MSTEYMGNLVRASARTGAAGQQLPLSKAIAYFALAATVVVVIGMSVGYLFFWNQYETVNPVDKDIKYYSGILDKDRDNVNALVELGWRYYRKGDYQEAVKILERAVRLKDSNTAAHFNLALSYKAIGLPGKAEAELIKVSEIAPDHKLVPYYLGQLFFEQERYDDAIQQFKKSVELDPAAADNFYRLGKVYEAKGYLEEALTAYERTLALVPGHKEAKDAFYKLQARLTED